MPKMAAEKYRMLPEADRADGFRRDTADHQHVDDAHEHPPQLGDDHGPGQAQRRQQVASYRVHLCAGGGSHKRANLSRVLHVLGCFRCYAAQKKMPNASATPYMIGCTVRPTPDFGLRASGFGTKLRRLSTL